MAKVAPTTYQVTVPAGDKLLLVYGLGHQHQHGDMSVMPAPVVVLKLEELESAQATSADTACYDAVSKALASGAPESAVPMGQVQAYWRLLPLPVQGKVQGLTGSDLSKLRLVSGWLQWGADKTG